MIGRSCGGKDSNMSDFSWFKDGKYGLFIHFGLYSLLGGEYRGKEVPGLSEWIMHTENIPAKEYEKLASSFDPVSFDSDFICRKASEWGMKYLCFTSKHHDGFAMYDSKADAYNSVMASPCKRDFVSELAASCQKYGLRLCLYYSQAQDWHHPDGYWAYQDNSGKNFRRYLDEKCIPQLKEILTNYGAIGMIWFDTPMGMSYEESKELADLVKKLQPDCLISGRIGNGLGDYLTTQDNRIPSYPIKKMWEVPGTLNSSWGYKKRDHNWHEPAEVMRRLLDIVSRGGNYLLNIGPRGDGSIPEESMAILDEIGTWLSAAGESLYGTRAVESYVYEAAEMRFTHKDHKLYLHVLEPGKYQGTRIPLPNIANTLCSAKWLNHENTEANPLFVGKTLEGDPFWGLHVPEDVGNKAVLTLAAETREKDFLQKRIDE